MTSGWLAHYMIVGMGGCMGVHFIVILPFSNSRRERQATAGSEAFGSLLLLQPVLCKFMAHVM
jgi:hypothetical protein